MKVEYLLGGNLLTLINEPHRLAICLACHMVSPRPIRFAPMQPCACGGVMSRMQVKQAKATLAKPAKVRKRKV